MKAIRTRYRGATGLGGSRIYASDGDGNSCYISYPHELASGEPAHRAAAEKLCAKLGWTGRLVGGWLGGNEYAFCFDPQGDQERTVAELREARAVLERHAQLVKDQTGSACDVHTAIGNCRRAVEAITGKREDPDPRVPVGGGGVPPWPMTREGA